MNISIRLATPHDCTDILHIRKEGKLSEYPNLEFGITIEDVLKVDLTGPSMVVKWTERLSNVGNYRTWVAESPDGKIIGCGSAVKKDTENMLFSLFIKQEWRGRGIGSLLVLTRLLWLGEDRDIIVKTTAYNKGALDYTKYGFFQSGNTTDLSIPGKKIPVIIWRRPKK